MRRYETIVIADPDLSEEKRESFSERIQEIISQQDGFVVEFDVWGNKKLAYEIRKKNRGFYIRIDYCGTNAAVDELERFFRIDDRSMKFMTILLEKDADLEAIKAMMAAQDEDAESDSDVETPAEEEEEESEEVTEESVDDSDAETPAEDEEEEETATENTEEEK